MVVTRKRGSTSLKVDSCHENDAVNSQPAEKDPKAKVVSAVKTRGRKGPIIKSSENNNDKLKTKTLNEIVEFEGQGQKAASVINRARDRSAVTPEHQDESDATNSKSSSKTGNRSLDQSAVTPELQKEPNDNTNSKTSSEIKNRKKKLRSKQQTIPDEPDLQSFNKEEISDGPEIKTKLKPRNEVNSKAEDTDLILSEYTSEEENEQNISKSESTVFTKIKQPKNVNPKDTKYKEHKNYTLEEEHSSEISKCDNSEDNENRSSRKSLRNKRKIKYTERESESDSDKGKSKRKTEVDRVDFDLSESDSEEPEPESEESDSSESADVPVNKRKKLSSSSKCKLVKPLPRALVKNPTYDKRKKKVDLSEMGLDSVDDSVKAKLKQNHLDGLVRYFFGNQGANTVQIDPELLQKKHLKRNKNSATCSNVVTDSNPGNEDGASSSTTAAEATSERVKGSDESSSESEWEEVSDVDQPMSLEDYNPEIPKDGIEINISIPDPRRDRRKKRQNEFANYARQFLNRFKKDTQVAMHKVHLLGYVAHIIHINEILSESLFTGLALSLLPNDLLGITTKRTTSILLTKLVTWFRSSFILESKENNLPLSEILLECLQTKVATSNEHYCYLFVIFGRAMKLDVRLCKLIHPISFKVKDLIPTERQKSKTSEVRCRKSETHSKQAKSVTKSDSKAKLAAETDHPKPKPEKGRTKRKDGNTSHTENKASTSKEHNTKRQRRQSNKNVSYVDDGHESESLESDEDFKPEKQIRIRPTASNSSKKNRKILSSDSENEIKKASGKPCIDNWAEVYINSENKWVCVDVVKNIVNRPYEIEANASDEIRYVLSVDNESKIKDVTQRYASSWLMQTQKLRVNSDWWEESLANFVPPKVKRELDEDKQLDDMLLNKPLPATIGEFKSHPLYVLKRHLLKFEALYPPDVPPLGYIRGEPVYARECVRILHSREAWKRQGVAVKLGEEPYKLVKARPRFDKVNKKIYTPEDPLDVYGEWQTEPWVSPPCKDGKVPRNEYGNVELFKESMLPAGAVHLRLPGLNRVARKLGIDCAPAMIGFDGSSSGIIPLFDGFVACEEYEEVLVAAWNEEQVNIAKRETEKYEKRVYGNWRKLIRGLLIREKIKSRYFSADKYGQSTKKESNDSD